jgi:Ca2+-binding EF-hand superfamily protein
MIFDLADADNSGTLDLEEVKGIAVDMGIHGYTDEIGMAQIVALDRDGDNRVDFAEFCQLLGCDSG